MNPSAHHKQSSRRTLVLEDVLADEERIRATMPLGPERRAALRKIQSQKRSIENRNERNGI